MCPADHTLPTPALESISAPSSGRNNWILLFDPDFFKSCVCLCSIVTICSLLQTRPHHHHHHPSRLLPLPPSPSLCPRTMMNLVTFKGPPPPSLPLPRRAPPTGWAPTQPFSPRKTRSSVTLFRALWVPHTRTFPLKSTLPSLPLCPFPLPLLHTLSSTAARKLHFKVIYSFAHLPSAHNFTWDRYKVLVRTHTRQSLLCHNFPN